jgi:hypothetical protein
MVLSSKLKGTIKKAKSKKGGGKGNKGNGNGIGNGNGNNDNGNNGNANTVFTQDYLETECGKCKKPPKDCSKLLLRACQERGEMKSLEGMDGVNERFLKLALDASNDAQIFNRLANPAYNRFFAREIAQKHILSILSNSKKFKEAESVLHFTGLNEQGSKLNNMIDLTLEKISDSELLLEGFNRADFKKFCSKERVNLYAELDTEVNKKLEEFMRKVMGEKYTTLKGETTLAKFKDFFSGRDFVESSKYIQVFRVLLLSELHSSSDEFTKIILENSGLSLKSLNDIKESLKLALTTGSQKGGGNSDGDANAQIMAMLLDINADDKPRVAEEYAKLMADNHVPPAQAPKIDIPNEGANFGSAAFKFFIVCMSTLLLLMLGLGVAYAMSTSSDEAAKALEEALRKKLEESIDPNNKDSTLEQGMAYISQAVGAASKEVTGLAKGITGVGVDFAMQQIINHVGILAGFLTTFGFFMVMKFMAEGKVTVSRILELTQEQKHLEESARGVNNALGGLVRSKRGAYENNILKLVNMCAAAASFSIRESKKEQQQQRVEAQLAITQLEAILEGPKAHNNNSGTMVAYNGAQLSMVQAQGELTRLQTFIASDDKAAMMVVESANSLYGEDTRKIFLQNPELIASIRRSLFARPAVWLKSQKDLKSFRDPTKRAQIFLKSINDDESYTSIRAQILIQFVKLQKEIAKQELEKRILLETDESIKQNQKRILYNLDRLTIRQAEIDFYNKLLHEGAPMLVDSLTNLVSNIILVTTLGHLYTLPKLHELIPLYQGIVDKGKVGTGAVTATYASSGMLSSVLGVALLQHPIIQMLVGGSAGIAAVGLILYKDLQNFNDVGGEILIDGNGARVSGYKYHLLEQIINKLKDYKPSLQGEAVIKTVVGQLMGKLEIMQKETIKFKSDVVLRDEIFQGKDHQSGTAKDVKLIFDVIHTTLENLDKLIPDLQTDVSLGGDLTGFELTGGPTGGTTGQLVPFQPSPGGGAAPPAPAAATTTRAPAPPLGRDGASVATGTRFGGARKKSRRQKRNNRNNRTTKRNRTPMKSKHQKRRNNGRMSSKK